MKHGEYLEPTGENTEGTGTIYWTLGNDLFALDIFQITKTTTFIKPTISVPRLWKARANQACCCNCKDSAIITLSIHTELKSFIIELAVFRIRWNEQTFSKRYWEYLTTRPSSIV